MGRNRKNVPSYLLHKASGQARVRINGRDIYLGKYGSKESKELYARLLAEHFDNDECETVVIAPGDPMSVATLVVKYDDHAQSYYLKNGKPTSQVKRIQASVRPLLKLYANLPVADFSPKKFVAVRSALIQDGSQRFGKNGIRIKTPLSRIYVNHLMGCVKRMFKWGVAEEYVPCHVYDAIKTVENLKLGRAPGVHEPMPIQPVPDQHISPVLDEACPQIRTMIELKLLTGMRPDEVTIMRPCNINRSPETWEYQPESHKTEHHDIRKTILLGPQAQQLLMQWLDRASDAYLFSPKEVMEEFNAKRRRNRKTPMTPSQSRRRKKTRPIKEPSDHYDDASYRQAVETVCRRVGVPKWTPGQLRHNAGMRIRAKFGLEAAQVVLGHQAMSTTEIYAERNMKEYAAIMIEMGFHFPKTDSRTSELPTSDSPMLA